jgi:enoyl-CoA hydratase
MAYETIIVETRGAVGLITLDRPKALNALSSALIDELARAAETFDADAKVGAIVITGSAKAFAAGADVKEMAAADFPDTYLADLFGGIDRVAAIRKPVVAAVAGFALGGGCELAMACDIVLAGTSAKFGQPEITLGIMPGLGGSQRLVRAIGKAKAMELCLSGRTMDATEAEQCGLVARIVPDSELVEEALKLGTRIAGLSRPAVLMVKESVNRAFEMSLTEGIRFERRMFQAIFATADRKEGLAAFVEKRTPQFRNR